MTVFVSGGAKSGKSALAQQLALKLSGGGKRYYIATMIPADEEDRERIRRHIDDRDGMDFQTVEQGRSILFCLDMADREGTFLLDSVTALLMNELFRSENDYVPDLDAARRCRQELLDFVQIAGNAVIVSDDLFSDAIRYGMETELYRKCLADIHRALARACDTVVEVCAGNCIIHKGELPE